MQESITINRIEEIRLRWCWHIKQINEKRIPENTINWESPYYEKCKDSENNCKVQISTRENENE